MKKILFLTLFTAVSFAASGKQKFGIDLGIGLKGGLNFNKVEGKGWKNIYNTDPHAGFFIHLNKRHVGVQLEAVWSQNHIITDSSFKGLYSQYIDKFDDSLSGGSFRFNTISLPFLLNLKLAQSLWIQLGPQFNANINVADENHIIKSGINIINQQSYSAVGGIWVQFGGNSPLLRINLGARYIAGLNNLNSLNHTQVWKNQMIQVHLGISY